MPSFSLLPPRFRLGAWTVNTAQGTLRGGGDTRRLRPLELSLLVFLVERRERVVTREEIFEVVWQGAAVEDGALARSISEIRKALDDDARQPRYIRTVPKRGYQCVAPVDADDEPSSGDPVPAVPALPATSPPRQSRFNGGALAVFMILSLGGMSLWLRNCGDTEPATRAHASLVDGAVLPDDPEFIRLYTDGHLSLNHFEAAKAREALEKAVARRPDEPYAQLALAEAWDHLGSRREVASAAAEASKLAATLPDRQKLWIEARALALNHQWSEATDLYRTLWNSAPYDLEIGIDLARVQIDGRQLREALETVAELRGLLRGDRQDPRLDLMESEAAQYLGEWARALEAAERAISLARPRGDDHALAKALAYKGFSHSHLGHIEEGRLATEESEALFRELGDQRQLAWFVFQRAGRHISEGEIDEGLRLYDESLAAYREAGDRHSEAMVLRTLGDIAADRGDLTGGEELIRTALQTYRELGDPSEEAVTLTTLAIAFARNGQFGSAEPLFGKALLLYRQLGNAAMTLGTLDNQAHLLLLQNRIQDAAYRYRDVLEATRVLELDRDIAKTQLNRGFLETVAGNLPQAREAFTEAIQLFRRLDDPQSLAASLDGLGQLHINAHELADARRLLEESFSMQVGFDDPARLAIAQRSMSRLYLAEGDAVRAEASARAAIAASEQFGIDPAADVVYLTLALLDQGRHKEAWEAIQAVEDAAGGSFSKDLQGLALTIVSAQARSAVGHHKEARRQLEEVLKVTESSGAWLFWAEAELALAELEMASAGGSSAKGNKPARQRLVNFQEEARERGFHLLAHRASSLLAPPSEPS